MRGETRMSAFPINDMEPYATFSRSNMAMYTTDLCHNEYNRNSLQALLFLHWTILCYFTLYFISLIFFIDIDDILAPIAIFMLYTFPQLFNPQPEPRSSYSEQPAR